MTTLAAAAAQTPHRRQGFPCGLGYVINSLSPDDQETLKTLLDEKDNSASWIAEVLNTAGHRTARGVPFGRQIIQNHRARICGCPR